MVRNLYGTFLYPSCHFVEKKYFLSPSLSEGRSTVLYPTDINMYMYRLCVILVYMFCSGALLRVDVDVVATSLQHSIIIGSKCHRSCADQWHHLDFFSLSLFYMLLHPFHPPTHTHTQTNPLWCHARHVCRGGIIGNQTVIQCNHRRFDEDATVHE